MKINEQFVIDYLTYKAGRPLKAKELAAELKIPQRDYRSFRNMLKGLVDSGQLVKLRRGRLGVPSELNLIVAPISIARSGVGAVTTESGDLVAIAPHQLSTALDGDRVMVRVGVSPEQEKYGIVIKIVQRSDKSIVGIFNRSKNFCTVIPDDRRLRRDIYVPDRLSMKAADGDRVLVKINIWDDPHVNPEGEVVEVLGDPAQPGVDLLTVIRKYNLKDTFPQKVLAAASKAAAVSIDEEFNRRRDFSSKITYTIDPSDAKDYDDAISIERTDYGYRLGVYIADVSFYVRADTVLDKDAFERGNSVYLPGAVVPMLPEKLSNDLCSLKPNRRRLVYAVLMNIDRKGKVLDWEIAEGVIRSRVRLTYEEVQHFFDTGRAGNRVEKVADSLSTARELAKILQKRRMGAGSLDFDLPEAKIVMNKKGEVVEIGNRIRLESHRLIEEFMLMANRTVALHVFRLAQKFLYRVHERPDLEKLEAFSYMMSTLGHKFPVSEHMKPIQFARFLEGLKGRPEEELVNELMLRSMKKAVYQPKNVGHFGLAFTHYTHFTSPIRRYPDLIVHRLLKKLENGRYPASFSKRLDSILTHVGRHCSDTERNAEAAEREAVRYKQTAFMSKKIGEHYNGVISGVLSFGFFVRLNTMGAEGMVRLSTIDDDYYHFDEKHFRLVGRRKGRIFQMGDPVRVGILSVDRIKNEIDLFLVEQAKYKNAGKKKRKRKP